MTFLNDKQLKKYLADKNISDNGDELVSELNNLINKIENEDHRIVISDLRFLHEYNLISNI